MDWWFYTKIFWSAAALMLSCAAGILIWKVKGILSWKNSLKKELKALRKTAAAENAPGKQCIQVITEHCTAVFKAFSPEINQLQDLPDFIRSIAACYHPQAANPELQVTIGHFLQCLEKSLDRFDLILQRKGFRKLRSINIRNIRSAHLWYRRISGHALYRWYGRHKAQIKNVSSLRLVLFPDPFVWLAYLSHQLTLVVLSKFLLVDIYLFIGKLAMEAYDNPQAPVRVKRDHDLEATLRDLESVGTSEASEGDYQIKEIRTRLIGLFSMLTSTPTPGDWKKAVAQALTVIAQRHFPESDFPMQEAAFGPLLERTRSLLASLGRGKEFPVVHRLYHVRLDTLYGVKNLADTMLPTQVRYLAQKIRKSYGWLKWPLKVYRWTRRSSPLVIALDVGWILTQKASLAYLYGKTFDRACEELEIVYSQSKMLKHPDAAGQGAGSVDRGIP